MILFWLTSTTNTCAGQFPLYWVCVCVWGGPRLNNYTRVGAGCCTLNGYLIPLVFFPTHHDFMLLKRCQEMVPDNMGFVKMVWAMMVPESSMGLHLPYTPPLSIRAFCW